MPISLNFSARVPVISADYQMPMKVEDKKRFNKTIFPMMKSIYEDKFMTALAGQLTVDKYGDFTLYPRMGSAPIVLGDTSIINNKFLRIKSLYDQYIPQNSNTKALTYSVKFKHQIIIKKPDNHG
jgi:hypothetical protein